RYRPLRLVESGSNRRNHMDSWRLELRLALRSLWKRPSFSLLVIGTLALGIGANTAIFSILHALVLRDLAVVEPSQLVVLSRLPSEQISQQFPLFQHYRAHASTLEGVLAFRNTRVRATFGGRTERLGATLISGNYFSVLGVSPAIGSLIVAADDEVPGS